MTQWKTTTVYKAVLEWYYSDKDLLVLEGGTSSSKTYSAIMALILLSITDPSPTLTDVVAESIPHLKGGAITDFECIMGDNYDRVRWNATDRIYTFPETGSKIHFFSADDPSKMRGPRRDRLYINEANNIAHESFKQLKVRTREGKTLIDHNPVGEYWAHEYQGYDSTMWHHSTYLDAIHVLPAAVVKEIESRKDKDPNWWRVYGLGLVGKSEGLIHPSFAVVDVQPQGKRTVYGLDFGYTNDPTALVRNDIVGDNLYSDEIIYERGLTNQQIAERMIELGVRRGHDMVIADSAEPKSIQEIAEYGFNILPARKGRDSLANGIQVVNQYRQHWTKRSVNCIKEQRNYRYIENKDGQLTNKPMDIYNHGMDARRYPVQYITSVGHVGGGRVPLGG